MAGRVTYKNLFSLVVEEIEKRTKFDTSSSYGNQLSRTSISPITGDGRSDANTAAIVRAIQDLLEEALPSVIIEGLEVTATVPFSNSINISAGKGSGGGYLYTLEETITLDIPFDDSTEVFYIILYKNSILIERTYSSYKLTIAKIIIPKPGTTCWVQDTKDSSWNAYIVNFKEYKLHGINDKFEEDTIELLRDNISPILADNIIGNIRLSEDLKIINTQGTLEMDSTSLKLLSTAGTTLAKFNRNGTFFYDTSGRVIAKFAVDEARVGNIIIEKNAISSGNYASEVSGFRIADSGFAEFEDVRVRGRISSSVFEYDRISAIGGKLLIGNASVLSEDITSSQTTITTDDSVFSLNEILRIKEGVNEEYLRITNISSAPTYTVTRGLNGSSYGWYKGTAIISTGTTNTGFISLDAISNYAPFIDIVLRNSLSYSDVSTKVRLGNLMGITDSLYGTLSGYGLYSDNVYLRGKLYAPEIKTAISGTRIELSSDGLFAYDASDNNIFSIFLESVSATADIGDVLIGNLGGDNYIRWDESEGVLTIRGDLGVNSIDASAITTGTLSADRIGASSIVASKLNVTDLSAISANLGTITAGTVTGAILQTASSGARVLMNTSNLIAYDDASAEIFKILISGGDVGDVIIGDYANAKGIKWDKSAATFAIKGAITASSGDFTGTVNVGTAGKVYIDGANEVIKVYDANSVLRVELGKLS